MKRIVYELIQFCSLVEARPMDREMGWGKGTEKSCNVVLPIGGITVGTCSIRNSYR